MELWVKLRESKVTGVVVDNSVPQSKDGDQVEIKE
jgi:hypothetical protein